MGDDLDQLGVAHAVVAGSRQMAAEVGAEPEPSAGGCRYCSSFFSPALSINDTELEAEAVLAGHVIGLPSGLSAAAHLRSSRRFRWSPPTSPTT
jgi:hypothetical protein